MGDQESERLQRHLDEADIRAVLYRYCRGIDRRDYDLVRSCYHRDASDHHGAYVGGVEGFIAYVEANLPRFDRTMHFLGNIMVEVRGDHARSEAYTLAFHRLRAGSNKPLRDFVVALRYVDDFERRDHEWRIGNRVCVFEWSRMDPVGESPFRFGEGDVMGCHGRDDPVFAESLAPWLEGIA